MARTSPFDYGYCEFPFSEWNPVQEKCLPYFTEDCNLVVSASTASGKTVIAEAVMGYELSRSDTSKVVYVSPLKAIGAEKHRSWGCHPTFGRYPKVLVSSDSDYGKSELESARMIISTVESMNLRCRARDRWIADVRALVFDEAHLINDETRGAGSESMVMSLSMLNPGCRIICLSGTLSNYLEIARWLKACNGKRTRYVSSSWRPSELVKRVEASEDPAEDCRIILERSRAVQEAGEKMLVFVHSKATGESLCRSLNDYGVRTAFYHAGLRADIRERMIADFRSDYSDLDVLLCTSSLSMGVTL